MVKNLLQNKFSHYIHDGQQLVPFHQFNQTKHQLMRSHSAPSSSPISNVQDLSLVSQIYFKYQSSPDKLTNPRLQRLLNQWNKHEQLKVHPKTDNHAKKR